MIRRLPGWIVAAVLAAPVVPVAAGGPELTVERGEGLTRIDAQFPAGLFGYAVPARADGTRAIYLLAPTDPSYWQNEGKVDDGDDGDDGKAALPPCPDEAGGGPGLTLYRVDSSGSGRLVSLRSDVPPDCELDALDLDRDGADELLLRCAGRWYRLDPDSTGPLPEPILENVAATSWIEPLRAPLGRVVPGRLQLHAAEPETGRLRVVAEVELPLRGKAHSDRVEIGSSIPTFVGRDGQSTAVFATAPQPVGKRRLRTTLIEVPAVGEPSATDCWVRLPAAEFVLEYTFLMLDAKPVLVVSTQTSDKLSLFGEKLLRVYPLRRDRSRLGAPPLLETRTRMNLWQASTVRAVDVDDDGVQDLVLGYWKGLKDDRIVLDAYLGLADGGFERQARTTSFDVPDGDRVFHRYGDDLDGDGHPDLLVRSGNSLRVYPGLPSSRGKKLVDATPREIPLGDLPAAELQIEIGGRKGSAVIFGAGSIVPVLVDLDGDGVPEIVAARDRGNLPGTFHAIRLRR